MTAVNRYRVGYSFYRMSRIIVIAYVFTFLHIPDCPVLPDFGQTTTMEHIELILNLIQLLQNHRLRFYTR